MSLPKYLLLFLLVAGCFPAQGQKNSAAIKFDKQGHRGCRGLMPENTIPAMTAAIHFGVTTLEMDVVVTRDSQLVLSHEPFFSHEISTKPGGQYVTEAEERSLNIYRMNYDEVKKYDVGMKPHPRFPHQLKIRATKPLLADVIDRADHYRTKEYHPNPRYNIEIKSTDSTDGIYHPAPAQFAEMLVTLVRSKNITDRVTIQSFDFRPLQYLHKQHPDIKLAMLIEDFDKRTFAEQLKALGFTPDVYSPHYSLVTEELVSACHQLNMKLIPWTVNDKNEITRLRAMGVNGIITDYPDLFRK